MYRFTLRMGRRDLDIIALSQVPGFSVAVRDCIRAFVGGKRMIFPVPASLPNVEKDSARVIIKFDDDEMAARFLKSIRKGNITAVVLTIIRESLPFPIVSPFLDDEGVYYDVFAKKGKRGRKKGTKNGAKAEEKAETRAEEEKTEKQEEEKGKGVVEERAAEVTRPQVQVAPAKGETVVEEPAVESVPVTAEPSADVPVRPSLTAMVAEEQAEDEEQTVPVVESADGGGNADNSDDGDDFDPLAIGLNMMQQI